MNTTTRHLTVVASTVVPSTRCTQHPAFEADYCPSCGTAQVIGGVVTHNNLTPTPGTVVALVIHGMRITDCEITAVDELIHYRRTSNGATGSVLLGCYRG